LDGFTYNHKFLLERVNGPAVLWVALSALGRARQLRFAGTSSELRKLPKNAQCPTSRVHPRKMAGHPVSRKDMVTV